MPHLTQERTEGAEEYPERIETAPEHLVQVKQGNQDKDMIETPATIKVTEKTKGNPATEIDRSSKKIDHL